MQAQTFLPELRRRGVFGALAAYVVVAAGALQLAEVVRTALELPGWSLKLLLGLAVAGIPITAIVSWFYDLTRQGLVRTSPPADRPWQPSPASPSPPPAHPPALAPSPSPRPLDANALSESSPPLAGRYRIERELGSGGMGRVLAAHDDKLGRRVAIKVLTGAHEPSRLARFQQEARAAGALEHPNVLGVYDLGEHEGSPFLVTELLDGQTLREAIRAGPMAPEQVQRVGLMLARGLEAAHARGVVHRDLKPENLFLTRDGRLKILDFGLAKLIAPGDEGPARGQGLTVTGAIFGTPGYLSPEQAKGLVADARSDVFAVGAVLYELLTGKRAFPGSTLVEAGHAALTQEPVPLPGTVSRALAEVVTRCLEKDAARRFQSGQELAAALDRVVTSVPAAALPGSQRRGILGRLFVVAVWAFGLLGLLGFLLGLYGFARSKLGRTQASPARVHVAPGENTFVAIPRPPEPPEPPQLHLTMPGMPKDVLAAQEFAEIRRVEADLRREQTLRRVRGDAGRAGVLQAVRGMMLGNQLELAEKTLRDAIERTPDDVYPRLHLFALQRRMGDRQKALDELKVFVGELEENDWIAPVARFYAGELSEREIFHLAAEEDDADQRDSQICEANFYLGLFYSTASPPDTVRARRFFENAAKSGTNDVESKFAQEELRALRRK